jgi:MFS family permease
MRGAPTIDPAPAAPPTPGEAERALAVVSLAVLLVGGTWFSGTAAIPALRQEWQLTDGQGAWLTIGVQLGFIAGTLLYSILNLADVFKARLVFLASALACAAFNAAFAALAGGLPAAVLFRFLTGVTLAGVYPVGMKIVASWFRSGLGWRLGILVGALVFGTASPYLIQAVGVGRSWRTLTTVGSASAVAGGLLVAGLLRDGPYLPAHARFDPRVLVRVFAHPPFRDTALGYFGHMWELYALWSLVSFYVAGSFAERGLASNEAVSLVAFGTVAMGALGCAAGGFVSRRVGERDVALVSLLVSGTMCLLSGFAYVLPPTALVAFLLVWGAFVVSDSPQFSALAARHCPPEYTGTALTAQNGIGFAVTVVSIQLLPLLAARVGWRWSFASLAIGPALGAWFMARLPRDRPPRPSP